MFCSTMLVKIEAKAEVIHTEVNPCSAGVWLQKIYSRNQHIYSLV